MATTVASPDELTTRIELRNLVHLDEAPVQIHGYAPAISDESLAFARSTGSTNRPHSAIIIRDLRTGTEREMISGPSLYRPVYWTNDGLVKYQVEVTYSIQLPTGPARPLRGWALAVSPDGSQVLMGLTTAATMIEVVDTRSLDVVHHMSLAKFADAFLTPEQRAQFDAPRDLDPEDNPLPAASWAPGDWSGEYVVMRGDGLVFRIGEDLRGLGRLRLGAPSGSFDRITRLSLDTISSTVTVAATRTDPAPSGGQQPHEAEMGFVCSLNTLDCKVDMAALATFYVNDSRADEHVDQSRTMHESRPVRSRRRARYRAECVARTCRP
jgi:hypothetical protein